MSIAHGPSKQMQEVQDGCWLLEQLSLFCGHPVHPIQHLQGMSLGNEELTTPMNQETYHTKKEKIH